MHVRLKTAQVFIYLGQLGHSYSVCTHIKCQLYRNQTRQQSKSKTRQQHLTVMLLVLLSLFTLSLPVAILWLHGFPFKVSTSEPIHGYRHYKQRICKASQIPWCILLCTMLWNFASMSKLMTCLLRIVGGPYGTQQCYYIYTLSTFLVTVRQEKGPDWLAATFQRRTLNFKHQERRHALQWCI